MPETFPDGFPMTPAEAIEFSYFFTEEEKQEWREWLKNVSDEEKTEMVSTLHAIWMDKQKQVVPDQFSGNTGAFPQSNQNQTNTQPNFIPQPDFYNSNQPQVEAQNSGMMPPAASPFDFQATNQPEFNFNQGGTNQIGLQSPTSEQFNPNHDLSPTIVTQAPTLPDFSFENDTNKSFSDRDGQPLQNLNQNNNGNPILNDPKPNPADFGLVDDDKDDFNFDFDDDFDLDDDKEEPVKAQEPAIKPDPETDDDSFNFDKIENIEPEISETEESITQDQTSEP